MHSGRRNNTLSRNIIIDGNSYKPYKFYMKLDDAEFWYCVDEESFDVRVFDINNRSEEKVMK